MYKRQILVNLPASGAITQGDTVGPISALFEAGMSNELFPLLLLDVYKRQRTGSSVRR